MTVSRSTKMIHMTAYMALGSLIIFNVFRVTGTETLSSPENVTRLLDKLLLNYKKEVRPNFGVEPLYIETDIYVRSLGPVSEQNMAYSMQCYFRQRWYDERLKFNLENVSQVTLSNHFLHNIWKPTTYFLNGRRSVQHNITVPNVFVRIRNDGLLYMSRRLTINALCPMMLMNFPMDKPVCPLYIGSYGYTMKDVIYKWKYGNDKSVELAEEITMSQFDMHFIEANNLTDKTLGEEYSILEVYFHFKRHIGFFMIQTYLPCCLIVCLSWVSFWINKDAAPARVLLGVTTILTAAAIGIMIRDGLPRVSYATGLDVYLNVCILYALAAMIEFAAVHYTLGRNQCDRSNEDQEDLLLTPEPTTVSLNEQEEDGEITTFLQPPEDIEEQISNPRHWSFFLGCLGEKFRYKRKKNRVHEITLQRGYHESRIDVWARYLFPSSFILFNIGYWTWYI